MIKPKARLLIYIVIYSYFKLVTKWMYLIYYQFFKEL